MIYTPAKLLILKARIKSKVKKTHSKAATPYQRLINSDLISKEEKVKLQHKFETLDPFELQKSIQKQIKVIFTLVNPCLTKQRVAI